MIALLYKGYFYYWDSLNNQIAIITLNITTDIYLVFPFVPQLCSKQCGGDIKMKKNKSYFQKSYNLLFVEGRVEMHK